MIHLFGGSDAFTTTPPVMAKTTFTVTLPNGTIATRKTARTYSHAVCFDSKALSWCGSFTLAQKRIAGISCPEVRAMLQIIPVNA